MIAVWTSCVNWQMASLLSSPSLIRPIAWPLASEWHTILVQAGSYNSGDASPMQRSSVVATLLPANDAVNCGVLRPTPYSAAYAGPNRPVMDERAQVPSDLPTPVRVHKSAMEDPIFQTSRRSSHISDWDADLGIHMENQALPDFGTMFNETFDTFSMELSQFLADNDRTADNDLAYTWE